MVLDKAHQFPHPSSGISEATGLLHARPRLVVASRGGGGGGGGAKETAACERSQTCQIRYRQDARMDLANHLIGRSACIYSTAGFVVVVVKLGQERPLCKKKSQIFGLLRFYDPVNIYVYGHACT